MLPLLQPTTAARVSWINSVVIPNALLARSWRVTWPFGARLVRAFDGPQLLAWTCVAGVPVITINHHHHHADTVHGVR